MNRGGGREGNIGRGRKENKRERGKDKKRGEDKERGKDKDGAKKIWHNCRSINCNGTCRGWPDSMMHILHMYIAFIQTTL